MKFIGRIIALVIISMIFWSCVQDQNITKNELVVRLSSEPDRLNPVLSRGSAASQIENFIFQPLAEIDPITLNFEPVLLDKIPVAVIENNPDFGVSDRVDMRLKADAKWSDGKSVTFHDVLFTLKTIFNDEVESPGKKAALSFIKGENHDENDLTFISFYLDTTVFNADKIIANFHVLPKHRYDSLGLLDQISLGDLISNDLDEEKKSALKNFATQFADERFSRTIVTGSGAYQLDNWNAGYEVKLTKKKDWWGDAHEKSNLFKAIPKHIIYKIIPDEQLAITALANDNIDVIAGLNPEKFEVMRETSPDKYQFLTPVIPQYFYIILNYKSPLLEDVKVRKALAHLVDQNKMINVVMNGFGTPVTAPLSPGNSSYDENVIPYHFDVEKATALLNEAGWSDSDQDGFVDKEIENAKTNLSLRLVITGSELGRKIALLFQDNAKKAGVDIKIVAQKFSPNTIDDMESGDFEMVASAARQSFLVPNLKASWHSSGHREGGNNMSGYSSAPMDEILEQLDVEENEAKRIKLYHRFHRQIHEDVPVLFLLMPTERLLVSNKWHVDVSPRRPGYFENMFYIK